MALGSTFCLLSLLALNGCKPDRENQRERAKQDRQITALMEEIRKLNESDQTTDALEELEAKIDREVTEERRPHRDAGCGEPAYQVLIDSLNKCNEQLSECAARTKTEN